MSIATPNCPFDQFDHVFVLLDDQTIPDKCGLCIKNESFKPDDYRYHFDSDTSFEAEGYRDMAERPEPPLFLYCDKISDQLFEISIGNLVATPNDPLGWWALQCVSKARIDCINYQPRLF